MSRYKHTPLKPTLIASAIFAFLMLPVPTAMGTGAYIIWTPLFAIAFYFAHNILRLIVR